MSVKYYLPILVFRNDTDHFAVIASALSKVLKLARSCAGRVVSTRFICTELGPDFQKILGKIPSLA